MNIESIIREYACKDILVEGPIEVTEDSYPFDSMKHCRVPYDLGDLGYCEEEYFISGYANVYDDDGCGNIVIKKSGLPYKTRVLVRKPLEKEKFSGRVYLDILNATNGYDHEDLWTRIYTVSRSLSRFAARITAYQERRKGFFGICFPKPQVEL